MAIKDNFLKEAKIGKNVEIMIAGKEISGKIVSLDIDTVTVVRADGKRPTIDLDSISYFEFVDDVADEDNVNEKTTIGSSTVENIIPEMAREESISKVDNVPGSTQDIVLRGEDKNSVIEDKDLASTINKMLGVDGEKTKNKLVNHDSHLEYSLLEAIRHLNRPDNIENYQFITPLEGKYFDFEDEVLKQGWLDEPVKKIVMKYVSEFHYKQALDMLMATECGSENIDEKEKLVYELKVIISNEAANKRSISEINDYTRGIAKAFIEKNPDSAFYYFARIIDKKTDLYSKALHAAFYAYYELGEKKRAYEVSVLLLPYVKMIQPSFDQNLSLKAFIGLYAEMELWDEYFNLLAYFVDATSSHPMSCTNSVVKFLEKAGAIQEDGRIEQLYSKAISIGNNYIRVLRNILESLLIYLNRYYSEAIVDEKIRQYLVSDNAVIAWHSVKSGEPLEISDNSKASTEKQKKKEAEKKEAEKKEAEMKALLKKAYQVRSVEKDLKQTELLYRELIKEKYSLKTVAAEMFSIMMQVKDYDLAAMYLGKIGYFYMEPQTYTNIKSALVSSHPRYVDVLKEYENMGENEDLLSDIPLSDKIPTMIRQKETQKESIEENHKYSRKNFIKFRKKANGREIERYLKEAFEYESERFWVVQELIYFLIQKEDYSKALEYLYEAGIIYLPIWLYDQYNEKIMSSLPSDYLEKSMNDDETKTSNIVIAQRAEKIERNIDKAIEYYKKSLTEEKYSQAAASNLVRIYNSVGMFDHTLSFLEEADEYIEDPETILDYKIETIVKSQRIDWSDKLIDTYKEKERFHKKFYDKNELLLKRSNSLAELQNYELAAKYYLQYLTRTKGYMTTSEKGLAKRKQTLLKLCSIYVALNNTKKANMIAKQILQIDEENEYAKNVVSGIAYAGTESIVEYLEKENVSGLILQIINDLSLETELKKKRLVNNGVFVGTVNEAVSIMTALSNQTAVSDEAKSHTLFALAKMIGQVMSRKDYEKENSTINEELYYYYIAKGSLAYGNYQLYRNEFVDNYDIARYYYMQAIKIMSNGTFDDGCDAVLINASHKYILSFFKNRESIKRIRDNDEKKIPISQLELKTNDVKKALTSPLVVSKQAFFAGMADLISNNTFFRKQIVRSIYENSELNEIAELVSELCESEKPEDDIHRLEYEDFSTLWNKARGKYISLRQGFDKKLDSCLASAFSVGELQIGLERIRSDEFFSFLSETDKSYIEEFISIFERLRRYNEIVVFDYKVENLTTAEDIRVRLEEQIRDYPTAFSYDYLLPKVQQLKAIIYKESNEIFGGTKPEISVELSGDCSVDVDALVIKVPIAFTNKNNVQNADNAIISILTPPNISIEDDLQLKRGLLLGNGIAYEELVSFKVSDDILQEKVFTIDVNIRYKYKKNMSELCDGEVSSSLTIPIYLNEIFEPIPNRFEPHKNGSAVKDESMFYGRNQDIENIIQRISDKGGNVLRGRCLALYGQTRTGKSTILYHLERKLRKIDSSGMIIINIGSIGEENLSGNDITEFLYTIIDTLVHELRTNHLDLYKEMNLDGTILDPDIILDTPNRGQLLFNAQFRKFMHFIESRSSIYNVIIMVDEFTYVYDWIRKGIMTDNFMKFWKAFIQNNNIFAIIIGQDHMMKFVNEEQFTNDFGSTDLKKVTYLNEADAKKLMDEPIQIKGENGESISRYKEGALDRLYELTCGSAFLIMNICSGLVDYLNDIQSVYITKAHINEYLRKNLASFEESRFFEPQYADKSELGESDIVNENKQLLRKIAKYSDKKEWAPIKYIVETDREKELLENLSQRDVIIIDNNERCKIKVALYKEWLIEHYGAEV